MFVKLLCEILTKLSVPQHYIKRTFWKQMTPTFWIIKKIKCLVYYYLEEEGGY